jgi:hypothetical protein
MKKVLALFAMLIGLSACHASLGVGDSGQDRSYASAGPLELAIAQASIGNPAGD